MEPRKPALRSWYSTPDINTPRSSRVSKDVATAGTNTTQHHLAGQSLPGVSSFLTPKNFQLSNRLSSPNFPHNAALRPGYAANSLNSMICGGSTNTNYATLRFVTPSARPCIQRPNELNTMDSHSALERFPTKTTTDTWDVALNFPVSTNMDSFPNEPGLVKSGSSRPTNPTSFRPVGVLLKKSKAVRPTFIAPPSPLVNRSAGPHSAYLYNCRGPTPAGPPWRPSSIHGNGATCGMNPEYRSSMNIQFCPSYSNNLNYGKNHWFQNNHAFPPSQTFANGDREIYLDGDTKTASQNILSTCPTEDDKICYREHTTLMPQGSTALDHADALHDSKNDVKLDINIDSKNENVSDSASVVTLLANDTSLYSANHAGTTSQKEGEVSLHDAKMQLSESALVQDSRSAPLTFTQSSGNSKVQAQTQVKSSSDEAEKSQPGLEMLSDVSLLVGSMSAGGNGGSSKSVSDNTKVPDQLTTLENPELGLCPPQATYVGSNSDLCGVQSDVSNGVPGDGTNYTELSPPLPSEQCAGNDDLQYVVLLKDVCTTMLSPEKRVKNSKGLQTETPSVKRTEISPDIVRPPPKLHGIASNKTENTSIYHGHPELPVDCLPNNLLNVHDSTGSKCSRPKRSQQSSEKYGENMSQPLIDIDQKKKKQNKENMFEINHMQLHDIATSKLDERSNSKANMQITFSSADPCNLDKLHLDSSTKHTRDGQLGGHTKMVAPAAQQHVTNVGTGEYYDWGLDECQNESAFVSTEAMAVSVEGTDGTLGSGSMSSYYDMINKQFDPLVIAEEEVTSTQPHEDTIQENIQLQDSLKVEESRSRNRSHICVTCFNFTSSSDDSSASTPTHSSSNPSDCNSRSSSKSSKTSQKKKSLGKTETCSLTCEICGRAFSSASNLTRHKRLFHPSLFLNEASIVELPLVSCHSMLPLSPSSIPSVKSPGSSYNLACHTSAGTKPVTRNQTKTIGLPTSDLDQKKRTKRKLSTSDETVEHKTLSTKKKKKNTNVSQKKHKVVSHEDSKITMTVVPQKRQRLKRGDKKIVEKYGKRQTRASSSGSRAAYKRCINFRTKRRTRINSTIPCPYCGHMFSVMSNLKRHTKQEHNDVYIFVCSICTQKFDMRRTLKKHIKTLHTEDYPFCCQACLACFQCETELDLHVQRHVVHKFPCEDCNLVFYTKDHLTDHMEEYHAAANITN